MMIPCDKEREPLGDEALAQEQAKAEKYVHAPERFTFYFIEVELRAENGNHLVLYGDEDWSCECDFFKEYKTCSHVMAVGRVLKTLCLVQPRGNGGETSLFNMSESLTEY